MTPEEVKKYLKDLAEDRGSALVRRLREFCTPI